MPPKAQPISRTGYDAVTCWPQLAYKALSKDMSTTNTTNLVYEQVTAMVDKSIAVVLTKASDAKGNLDLEGAISTSKIGRAHV